MRKAILFILYMIVSCLFSFTQDINLYSPELIHSFGFGSGENQLGAGSAAGGAVGNPGRLNFTDDLIYLNDYVNSRFVFYDYNFNVQNIIEFTPQSSDIQYVSVIRIDEQGNLYGGIVNRFHKANLEGEEIYSLPQSRLSEYFIGSNEYWLYSEYVLFYSDSGRPMAIDPEGTILSTDEIQELLQEMKEQNPYWQDERYRAQIDEFLEENDLMLRGSTLLTYDLEIYNQYWSIIGGNDNSNFIQSLSGSVLKGVDNEGNTYWGTRTVEDGWFYSIFSEEGVLLYSIIWDIFASPVVSPNGDLYLLYKNHAAEQYEIYYIERQW